MVPDWGLLVLRLSFGVTMLLGHGLEKLLGFQDKMGSFPDPLGIGSSFSLALAVAGEVVAPVLIIAGFRTRLAAIPAGVTMAVAAFVVHGTHGFSKQELALVYLFGFVAIGMLGPGKFSFDGKRKVR